MHKSTKKTYWGPTLHKGQFQIVNTILKNHNVKFHSVVTPRQFGKTFMGTQLMLYWGINNPKSKIFWTSPQYSQAIKVMKELYSGIRDTDVVYNYNRGENIIELFNGSELYFRSVENADAMRGYSADYLICDEFAFYKPDVWNMVLKPTMLVRGKQAMFISTPKGKNVFYELHNMGTSDEFINYMSHRGHHIDNPFADKQEIADAKKVLPDAIYRQEYNGEFIDDGGEVFANINDMITNVYWQQRTDKKYYAGIDTGNMNDATVCTIIDEDGNVVDIYHKKHTTWNDHINNIARILQKWNAQALLETNHNGAIIEEIRKQYRNVNPFVTTSKSKPDIIERLIMRFQDSNITIPEQFPMLKDELASFSFTYNAKTRYVNYAAAPGMHDDCVMSLAIAFEALKQRVNTGNYNVGVIGSNYVTRR